MSVAVLDSDQLAVLARYGPVATGLKWVQLASDAGFSGAIIWRGEDETGRPVLALKAWPPAGATRDQLVRIHLLMARAAHLPFVPAVFRNSDGSTVTVTANRTWDLTSWMPGVAESRTPSPARLANACEALARLHLAWSPALDATEPCPGVLRRLRVLHEWKSLIIKDVRFVAPDDTRLAAVVRHAADVVTGLAGKAEAALRPVAGWPVAVRPCLCDPRRDHVLFSGDSVTGLVDYGATREDNVAVDLARLLGDLVGDDDMAFAAGLDAYRAAGGPLDVPAGYVRLLDRTGVVCALAGWVLRLAARSHPWPSPAAVAARIEQLIGRLDGRAFP